MIKFPINLRFFRKKEKLNRQINRLNGIEFACVPRGETVFAIGDIHGELQLWEKLHAGLRALPQASPDQSIKFLVLGDMIDRGPESAKTLESIIKLQNDSSKKHFLIALKGNHEQMLIEFLDNPEIYGSRLIANGGISTLLSYGVHCPSVMTEKQLRYLRDEFAEKLPKTHLQFLNNLVSKFTIGDFFFCHAGVKRSILLADQAEKDLIWTSSYPKETDEPQEKIIVHGHVPVTQPVKARYHVNVDTGAYLTGKLTAVRLHENSCDFWQVSKSNKFESVESKI